MDTISTQNTLENAEKLWKINELLDEMVKEVRESVTILRQADEALLAGQSVIAHDRIQLAIKALE